MKSCFLGVEVQSEGVFVVGDSFLVFREETELVDLCK